MARLYTADPHFGHANIVWFCKRPPLQPGDIIKGRKGGERWVSQEIAYKRRDEMIELMTTNWNQDVTPKDDVYVLGDFCFGKAFDFTKNLNGKIHLVLGNHDHRYKYKRKENPFVEVEDVINLHLPKNEAIFLAHYAHRVWPRSHKGSYHLYGHSHDGLPPWGLSFDCGMDGHDYRLWREEEVLERFREMKENIDWFKTEEKDNENIIPGCKSKDSEDAFVREVRRSQDEGTGASGQ